MNRRVPYGMKVRSGYGPVGQGQTYGWDNYMFQPSSSQWHPGPIEQEQSASDNWGPQTFRNPQAQEQWNFFDSVGGDADQAMPNDPYGAAGNQARIARMVAQDRANSAYNADGSVNMNSANGRYLAGIMRRAAAPDDGRGTEQRAFSVGGPQPIEWGAPPGWDYDTLEMIDPNAAPANPTSNPTGAEWERYVGVNRAGQTPEELDRRQFRSMGRDDMYPSRNMWDDLMSQVGFG